MKILIFYFENFNYLEKNAFNILKKKNNELYFKKLHSSSKPTFSLKSFELYFYFIKKYFLRKKFFFINKTNISNPDFIYVHRANKERLEIVKQYLKSHHINSTILFSDLETGSSKKSLIESILNKRNSIFLNIYSSHSGSFFLLQNLETPTSRLWVINYKKLINLSICYLDELFIKSCNLVERRKLDLSNISDNSQLKLNVKNIKNYIFYLLGFFSQKNIKKEFDVFFYMKNRDPIKIKTYHKRHSADPFLINYNNIDYIFFEEIENQKGHISLTKINKNSSEYLGKIIDEDFHLSFPFIFEDKGRYFMIPESCNDKSLRLYESKDFPFQWKFKMKLIKDVDFADSIIIKSKEIYFILTSERIEGYHNSYKIFYSKDLESTDWKPHKLNPIMINNYSRNAGMFIDKEKIILVFQQYNFNDYGNNIRLFELNKLSTSTFGIEEINKGQYMNHETENTHHFVKNAYFNVFDKQSII